MPQPSEQDKHDLIARLERTFAQAAEALAPMAPGTRLLLGCSAGGDSMALLDLAARLSEERGWRLAVAHLDHAQRPESADEAQWVIEQARTHGVAAFVERLGPRACPEFARGALSEDAMRRARHATFTRFARLWQADALVLAHQADDRAETFLIRLLAGAGPTGLAAIRPLERVGALTIVRPLLEAGRSELRAYLRARGRAWRDDPTNDSLETQRGWVRQALLPTLRERMGTDPVPPVARAAALIGEEATALSEATRLMLAQLTPVPDPLVLTQLDLAHPLWREAGPLVRRQLLREWLWSLRRAPHPPSLATVMQALEFAQKARAGAELRTIECIHLIHARTALLAFSPDVDAATRRAAAAPWLEPGCLRQGSRSR